MKYNSTYRLLLSCFFVGLLIQVIALQSIHRIFGHSVDLEKFYSDENHIESIENDYLSCILCLFQYKSDIFETSKIRIAKLNIGATKKDIYQDQLIGHHKYIVTKLRAPPTQLFF